MEIGSLADWVAAIGTVSACVIALQLARRQSRPDCHLHSSLWGYSDSDADETRMRAIDISVSNVGYQPFSVGLCMLSIGLFGPSAFEVRGDTPGGPILLHHAERVVYTFPLTEIHETVQAMFRSRPFGWIERRIARSYKGAAYLSSGELRTCMLDGASRRYLASPKLPADSAKLHRSHREPRYFKARVSEQSPNER